MQDPFGELDLIVGRYKDRGADAGRNVLYNAELFNKRLSVACEKKVDLIVHNARVYTSDDNYTNVSSFVVDEGKFIEVGGEELVEKYKSKNTVNARGLPIFPGFIDSHCHLLNLGLKKFEVDLKGTKSFEEIIDKLKDYSSNKKLSVLRGAGWDQNDWDKNSQRWSFKIF